MFIFIIINFLESFKISHVFEILFEKCSVQNIFKIKFISNFSLLMQMRFSIQVFIILSKINFINLIYFNFL